MRKMEVLLLSLVMALAIPGGLFAQEKSPDPAVFAKSLHGTRIGKAYCYSSENGGFETLTKIKMADLGCMKCHPKTYGDGTKVETASYEPSCRDCHDFAKGNEVPQTQCLQCHSRQITEIEKLKLTDVHREKGLTCMDCHSLKEVHGDGKDYVSKLQPGATETKCEKCHKDLQQNEAHKTHAETVACTACHNQTVITCYNCHFESLVQSKEKRPYGVLKDFMLLTQRQSDNKIAPTTFFVLTYQGKSFYALAPYASHSVMKTARTCQECHNTEATAKIAKGEKIQLTKWDKEHGKIVNAKGIIPVPSNWKEVFEFDYLTYTGDTAAKTVPEKWQHLKSETDLSQMLFTAPLTEEQIKKLTEKH